MIPLLRQTSLQHKHPYCNMSSNDSKMRCRCSQPPPLPTPPREQYAVIILCQPVLGSSPRQFVFPIPKIIRSQLCSPLPCRCRRSGRGAVAARHTATACAGRARPASASWDIRAAADPICTAGRDWEMRRRQLAEAIRRAIHSASTVSANRQVLISSILCVRYARSIVWPPSGWIRMI